MTKKCFWFYLGILVLIGGASVPTAYAQNDVTCVRGKPNAPIRLEVFSDFQCPACRAFYLQTVRQIFTNYADAGKVCVVYRSYPNFQYSRDAARFAHAALRIGPKQWGAVADALFEKQPEWSQTGKVEAIVAAALGPKDMDTVRKNLEGPAVEEGIDSDIILGSGREVNSTPTFFITSKGKTEKVEAALTYAAMQRRFDELLK